MIYDWSNKKITLNNGNTIRMCPAFFQKHGAIIKDKATGDAILHAVSYDTKTQYLTTVNHDSKTGKIKRYMGRLHKRTTAMLPTLVFPGIDACSKPDCKLCLQVQKSFLEEMNNYLKPE